MDLQKFTIQIDRNACDGLLDGVLSNISHCIHGILSKFFSHWLICLTFEPFSSCTYSHVNNLIPYLVRVWAHPRLVLRGPRANFQFYCLCLLFSFIIDLSSRVFDRNDSLCVDQFAASIGHTFCLFELKIHTHPGA